MNNISQAYKKIITVKQRATSSQRSSMHFNQTKNNEYSNKPEEFHIPRILKNPTNNSFDISIKKPKKKVQWKRQMTEVFYDQEPDLEEKQRIYYEKLNSSMRKYISEINTEKQKILNFQETVMMQPFYMRILQRTPNGDSLVQKLKSRKKLLFGTGILPKKLDKKPAIKSRQKLNKSLVYPLKPIIPIKPLYFSSKL